MNGLNFSRVASFALGTVFGTAFAFAQTNDAISSGPAVGGSPAWFLQGVDPLAQGGGGRPIGPDACADDMAKFCSSKTGADGRQCQTQNLSKFSGRCKTAIAEAQAAAKAAVYDVPNCIHSPVCDPPKDMGGYRLGLKAVEWKPTMGYTFAYPIVVPEGERGGMVSVAIDSKDNVWGFQRNPPGRPQLFEWDKNHKLIRSIGDNVIGHQGKAHGTIVDAHDNLWINDAAGSTVEEISPDGKVLKTIGVRGHRGDWVESKGQRLLWQPLMVAFNAKGDIYIAEGHANESPNDTASDDLSNVSGAARVIHLDKDGNFLNQWYGNAVGQGRFSMAHGFAVDPKTGDVYIGDREQYRIVVYTGDGQFLRTMQMRNLSCALNFDRNDQLWMASGWDGQFLKLDKQTGKVLGAIGNGNGSGDGQFLEASYFAFDSHDNIWTGDTSRGRITEMVAPQNRKKSS